MSINTLLSNPYILGELATAIGGGGGSLTFSSPLENEGGNVSLVIGSDFKVNGSELALNTNNVGTEGQLLSIAESCEC